MKVNLWLFPALLACVNFKQSTSAVSEGYLTGVLDLSYEECFRNGTCESVTQFVKDKATPFVSPWQEVIDQAEDLRNLPSRTKRWIFGVDNRLRIRAPFTQTHPFSSTVAISTGDENVVTCSGIALSRYLILTAAHCLLSPSGKLKLGKKRITSHFHVSLRDEGPTLETLDFTIRIGSTAPTFLYFDLYLNTAYAAHYVYVTFMRLGCSIKVIHCDGVFLYVLELASCVHRAIGLEILN